VRGPVLWLIAAVLIGPAGPGLAATTPRPASQPASRALPVDEGQEEVLLKLAGKGFRIRRTPHFLIAYNTAPATMESLSSRLEQTYDSINRFCQKSGFTLRPLNRRLEVLFFDTWPDYERYSRQYDFNYRGTYGFYYEQVNRSAFFNVHNDPGMQQLHASIEAAQASLNEAQQAIRSIRGNQSVVELTYPDGKKTRLTPAEAKKRVEAARQEARKLELKQELYCDRINRTVVQHEVAHHVLYNNGVHARMARNPRWVIEGLACMFETPPSSQGTGIAAVNHARLKDFRTAVSGGSDTAAITVQTYRSAVAAGRMTSLRRLVSDPDLFDARGQRGAIQYAAAWGLIHYLHREHNQALASYLRDLAARRPGSSPADGEELQLFEKHFGPISDAFVSRVANYLLNIPYRPDPNDL
jgi:hypothetical protein